MENFIHRGKLKSQFRYPVDISWWTWRGGPDDKAKEVEKKEVEKKT